MVSKPSHRGPHITGGGGHSDDDGPDDVGLDGGWGGLDAAGGLGDGGEGSLLSGAATELLRVPRRVEKVEVNYSRAAKQVRLRNWGRKVQSMQPTVSKARCRFGGCSYRVAEHDASSGQWHIHSAACAPLNTLPAVCFCERAREAGALVSSVCPSRP